MRVRIDPFAIVAIAFLGFLIYNALLDWGMFDFAVVEKNQISVQAADQLGTPPAIGGSPTPQAPAPTPVEIDGDAIRYPYDSYTLSSKAHMACLMDTWLSTLRPVKGRRYSHRLTVWSPLSISMSMEIQP